VSAASSELLSLDGLGGLGLQVIPSSCYDRTATNSHPIYALPLTLRLFNPTMLHATLGSDSQILVRRAQPRVAAEAAEAAAAAAAAAAVETVGSGEAGSAGFKPVAGLVGVGSLAAPVRVGPRSSATVALVVDLRGLLLDMRELNDALGELEGEVLLVDTRVRLSALGVTLRLDIPAAANISLSNMR